MSVIHVIHQGGPLDGVMASIAFAGLVPSEVRYPDHTVTREEAVDSKMTSKKIPCIIYRFDNVQKAEPPLRGLQGAAVFLRKAESLPGLVHPV